MLWRTRPRRLVRARGVVGDEAHLAQQVLRTHAEHLEAPEAQHARGHEAVQERLPASDARPLAHLRSARSSEIQGGEVHNECAPYYNKRP